MERFFTAIGNVMSEGTLLAPRGAALLCLLVAAAYFLTAVLRAHRLHYDAEMAHSHYRAASYKSKTANYELWEMVVQTFKEYMSKIATFCLLLAGAMAMFGAQAYVEAVRSDPAVYSTLYSHWIEKGVRALPPNAYAALTEVIPDTYDYLTVLFVFGALTVILAAAWALVPALISKSDETLYERAQIWWRELTGRKSAVDAKLETAEMTHRNL